MNVQKDLYVSGRLTVTNTGGTTPAANRVAVSTDANGLVDFVQLSSITGSVTTAGGTPNYLAKWTSSGVLGNSLISESGSIASISSGSLLVGSATSASTVPAVDAVGTICFVGSDVATNSTQKLARMGVRHYTNSEEPVAIVTAVSNSGTSVLTWGGGTSLMNAVTQHSWNIASNNTTTTGTELMRLHASTFQVYNIGGAWGPGTQNVATGGYVQSRGMNLLTNGTAQLQSNYNFTSFTYDNTDSYAGSGCFKISSLGAVTTNDEFIPVDIDKYYRLTAYAKSFQFISTNNLYLGIAAYDADGNAILPYHHMRQGNSNTNTRLALPLAVGDMVINVDSVANWSTSGVVGTTLRNLLVYGYQNALGTVYPDYTYSRFAVIDAWYGSQQIVGCVLTNQGSGYTNGTYSLGFSGGGGSGAAGSYFVSGGIVVGIKITATGSGYTSAPTISFPSGGGSGAAATALVTTNSTTGTVQYVSRDLGGSGYSGTTVPVTFSGGNATVQATGWAYIVSGVVDHIVLTSQGSGYTSQPTVTIGGAGSGATAYAAIGSGIDSTNNKIYLRAMWPYTSLVTGSSFPIGTGLANGGSGGTYKYIAAAAQVVPATWTKYSGVIGGIETNGSNSTTKFPYGTAYVKILWLANYNSNPTGNSANGVVSTTIGTRGSYTTVPSVTFATAPGGAGTPTAAGVAVMRVATIAVNAGGSGYAVGEILTISGGTGSAAKYTITGVSGGAVTTVSALTTGRYTALPATTGAATTVNPSGGTGATFNLTFEVDSISVTQTGYGYTSDPAITFGSGTATATATRGSSIQGFSSLSFTEVTSQNVNAYQNVAEDYTVISLSARAIPSQSANLFELQNSSGTALTSVAVGGNWTIATGNLVASTGSISTTNNQISAASTVTTGQPVLFNATASGGEVLQIKYMEQTTGSISADHWQIRTGGSASRGLVLSVQDSTIGFHMDSSGRFGFGAVPSTSYKVDVTGAGRFTTTLGVGDVTSASTSNFHSGYTSTRYLQHFNLRLYLRVDDNAAIDGFYLENRHNTYVADQGIDIRWRFGTNTSDSPINAGRIHCAKEVAWTSTTSTQDSYMSFSTTLDGNLGERMRITSGGNVGIGVTAPDLSAYGGSSRTLSIQAQAADTQALLELIVPDLTGTNNAGQIRFINKDGGSSIVALGRIIAYRDAADDAIAMAFGTQASTAAGMTTKMTILGNGNVGIGTTSPQQMLELSNATASTIRLTRTTGPVRLELGVAGTTATIGTITNHALNINVNSVTILSLASASSALTTDGLSWFDSGAGSMLVGDANSFTFYGQAEEVAFKVHRTQLYTQVYRDFIMGSTDTKRATFTLTNAADITDVGGTTTASSTTSITGSSTTFLSEVGIGDRISLSSSPSAYVMVSAIASDTSLTVDATVGNGTTQTINVKSAITRWEKADGTPIFYVNDLGYLVVGGVVNTSIPMTVLETTGGQPTTLSLRSTATATANHGTGLVFTANRTTNGATNIAQISGIITDISAAAYKGALIFRTADNSAPSERWRMNNKGHFIHTEVSADPALAELTSDQTYFAVTDRMAIYMKNDKFVVAYNVGGTVNYLTIPLNGSTTTWTQSTTAP